MLEHALQCGFEAEQAGEPDAMIVAAFLHDIGHIVTQPNDRSDDRHQEVGATALEDLFGPEVCEPIRLHVAAKRYLCCRESGYYDGLSAVSKKTLEWQGGVYSNEEAEAFMRLPYADAALRIRRYDEMGKQPNASTPDVRHFLKIAERLLRNVKDSRGPQS